MEKSERQRQVIQMETIEVAIRIPKQVYEHINIWKDIVYDDYIAMVGNAILNCTVLPKGHGKLIDSNVLWDAFQDLGQDFYEAFDFAEANAVIDADKDGEDGR